MYLVSYDSYLLELASYSFFVSTCTVPPAQPNIVSLESFSNKTSTRITWNLTEHTIDATPDSITVTIDDSPVVVQPEDRELVFATEPGDNYIIIVITSNPDGQTNSSPAHLILPPEGDKLMISCQLFCSM